MIIIIFKRDPLQENLQDISKMQSMPQIDQQTTSLVYNWNSFSGFYIRIKTWMNQNFSKTQVPSVM